MDKKLDDILTVILGFLAIIFMVAVLCAISWSCVCGMVYILSLFLPIPFSVKTVTGVWLSVCFLKMIFSGSSGKGKT